MALRQDTHRVIPPPPPQHKYTRWSAVMFCRPNAEADLYPLINLSPKIAEAAATNPVMSQMEKGITAGGWYKRRIAGQRVKNGISWNLSRGTERESQSTGHWARQPLTCSCLSPRQTRPTKTRWACTAYTSLELDRLLSYRSELPSCFNPALFLAFTAVSSSLAFWLCSSRSESTICCVFVNE